MCGLVGMAGYLEPFKHKAVMRDLLFLDTLRGRDSTGLTVVNRDGMVLTRKMTCPGYEFIEYPVVDRAMCFADQLWMGHNRFKTTGSVSRANAHPFEVLDNEGDVLLVGAHNGTLDNKWEVERELKGDKFDTDSEALFNLLADKADFKEAIKVLKGAWSLTFWDATTNRLHFVRNDKRPMCYAWSKDRKVLVWASEAWMIINACRRNGMELETNERGLSCYSTTEDKLYSLTMTGGKDQQLEDMVVEGGYAGAPAAKFQSAYDRVRRHWWNAESEQERAKEASKAAKERAPNNETDKKVIHIGEPPAAGKGIRGFGGEVLTLNQFLNIRNKGCMWCGDKFDKDKGFAFITEDRMVCLPCIHDSHDKGGLYEDIDEDEDFLDDDLPFNLTAEQKDTPEGKRLIDAAVEVAKAALGE